VLRSSLHFGVALLLVIGLISGACFACAPVSSGGCCDSAGHCKRISKNCDPQPVALPEMPAPVADLAVQSAIELPVPQIRWTGAAPAAMDETPPDLCSLHSVFRI
jgi:hypothetical protein